MYEGYAKRFAKSEDCRVAPMSPLRYEALKQELDRYPAVSEPAPAEPKRKHFRRSARPSKYSCSHRMTF